MPLQADPLHSLRCKLQKSVESASVNPFHGLPVWARETFQPKHAPIVCCGTGHWAGAFLHYAAGLEMLAVVDDAHAGATILGHPCLDTAGLIALARQRPEIVCVNTGQSDAGFSHFERVGAQHGLKMLNYLQAVRAFQTNPDIRVADWKDQIIARIDQYLALEPLLADALSVETLYSFLLYHLDTEREVLLGANRPGDATYFRSGLFGLGEHEVYVDCGSYDGDSVQRFIQVAKGRFRSVHAFEPDPSNFRRMQEWLGRQSAFAYAERVTLHQNAVGRAAGLIRFNETGGEGACVPITTDAKAQLGTPDGIAVEVVSLDTAVNEPISLMKLDVEGHEIEILRGAERHLQESKPKLAICAYHLPTDLIELPKFLQNLDAGYRLGLRHHSNSRYDTVLYAF